MVAKLRLLGFLMHTPINHMMLSWANEKDRRVEGLSSFKHWQDVARTLEKACFDGIFFADVPTAYDHYKDSTDEAVRYGVSWPAHDPLALVGPMAAATEHLGFAVTVSIASQHPFLVVRSITTLDHLSGGRVGWNVVSGHARAEHRALGLDQLDHDERYDRADEYMEICYALWDGIPPEAILMDKETGIFAIPEKIRKVDFKGKYLKCQTTPAVLPSPAGRPAIFQAGSSGRGQLFAVKHADVIFSIQAELSGMKRFMEQVDAAAREVGRKDPTRVTFAFQPFIGGTEEEARKLHAELKARIPIDAALARVSGTLGTDFSKLDLDQPLTESDTQASRGLMAVVSRLFGNTKMTIREALERTGSVGSIPQVIGTPEQIADHIETAWRETGCLGFNITPPLNPGGLVDFAEQVVPILQKRGIFRTEYESTTLKGNMMG